MQLGGIREALEEDKELRMMGMMGELRSIGLTILVSLSLSKFDELISLAETGGTGVVEALEHF